MPTPRQPFDQNYTPGKTYTLDGALLNRHHAVLEGSANRMSGPYAHANQGAMNVPPGSVIGIATITDAGNTCATVDGEFAAPCASVNKYLAHFRYYDTDTNRWRDYDEDLQLDASGYWEGVVIAGTYQTDASQSPTRGQGYGAIPAFTVGDEVPCYFDIGRGWLVPIVSPPADAPGGEMVTTSVVSIPDGGVSPNVSVVAVLETLEPGALDWSTKGSICFRVPEDNTAEWVDSRSGFCVFRAPSSDLAGTFMRIRVGKFSDYNIRVWEVRLKFFGIGRNSGNNYYVERGRDFLTAGTGKVLTAGWNIGASITGRYKDSPTFNLDLGGNLEITYLDPGDNWFVGCEFEITIANDPPDQSQTSVSSESSSTYLDWSTPSSLSSLSSSSSTNLMTSSSSTLSSSSSTQALTTSSTESSLSSSSTTSVNSSSSTSDSNYCCVTLVSDVICDQQGHVLEVCYKTICFPRADGYSCSNQVGPENCYPCDIETSLDLSSQSPPTAIPICTEDCDGYCEYTWNGSTWSVTHDSCVVGASGFPAPVCDCLPPAGSPTPGTFVGQRVRTCCNYAFSGV